jgi:hypothetical protein
MSLTLKQKDNIRRLRNRWIFELRYGNLNQHKSSLANRDYTAFCCLGVACEALGNELHITRSGGDGGYTIGEFPGRLWEHTTLFPEVRKELGLSEENQSILVTLNDNGASFSLISDAINAMDIHEVKEL